MQLTMPLAGDPPTPTKPTGERVSGFRERLARIMTDRRLSQRQLARMLGGSNSLVTHWMKGSIPQGVYLERLAGVLGVSPEWLLTGESSVESDVVMRDVVRVVVDEVSTLQRAGLRFTADDVADLVATTYRYVRQTASHEDSSEEVARRFFASLARHMTRGR